MNCFECNALLGSLEPVIVETPLRTDGLSMGDDDEEPSYDPELDVVQTNERDIGARIALAPGFVNARKRHESGHPWYVRGRRPEKRSPNVRVPFVVTCRCGAEFTVSTPEAVSKWAQLTAAGRVDALIDEAGDRYIQQEIDFRRGK